MTDYIIDFFLGFCFCKTYVSSRNVKKFIALNIVQLWQNCTATNWVCVYSIKFLSCSTMQHVHFVCQLSAASRLLELTQQPHSYLIETVRQRDAQISTLKERVSSLEDDVRYVDTIGVLKYETTHIFNNRALCSTSLISNTSTRGLCWVQSSFPYQHEFVKQ